MTALNGITIIETAERPAGEYTAKLLADFGATVIKVERPGGAPTRHMGPLREGESALFAWLNANKKSVVLDLADPADRATLDRLLARAHALVDDHGDGQAHAELLDGQHLAGCETCEDDDDQRRGGGDDAP